MPCHSIWPLNFSREGWGGVREGGGEGEGVSRRDEGDRSWENESWESQPSLSFRLVTPFPVNDEIGWLSRPYPDRDPGPPKSLVCYSSPRPERERNGPKKSPCISLSYRWRKDWRVGGSKFRLPFLYRRKLSTYTMTFKPLSNDLPFLFSTRKVKHLTYSLEPPTRYFSPPMFVCQSIFFIQNSKLSDYPTDKHQLLYNV